MAAELHDIRPIIVVTGRGKGGPVPAPLEGVRRGRGQVIVVITNDLRLLGRLRALRGARSGR